MNLLKKNYINKQGKHKKKYLIVFVVNSFMKSKNLIIADAITTLTEYWLFINVEI